MSHRMFLRSKCRWTLPPVVEGRGTAGANRGKRGFDL
jgi:hypothetical protein